MNKRQRKKRYTVGISKILDDAIKMLDPRKTTYEGWQPGDLSNPLTLDAVEKAIKESVSRLIFKSSRT